MAHCHVDFLYTYEGTNHDATEIDNLSKQLSLLQLCKKTGYTLIQENGQRRYGGPPPNWTGPYPAQGSEVNHGDKSEIIWATLVF